MATFIRRRDRHRQWLARVRRKGYPPQAKAFVTKAEAEAWARQIEGEIDRGAFICRKEAERTTLGEALERYEREITPHKKSARQEHQRIDWLLRQPIAQRSLASLRGVDMAAYRDARLASGRNPTTVNNELILLSHLFNVAIKEWGLDSLENPVSKIRRPRLPKGRDRRISPHEERLLLEAADPELRVAVILALESGMRRGEILGLRREWIDAQYRVLRLPDTKNGERREVPLSSRALDALQTLPPRLDGRVFSVSADVMTQRFRKVARTQGLDGLRFHDTRHEATSRLFEQGLNLLEVSAITGHKTLGMLKRYAHLRAADLARKLG